MRRYRFPNGEVVTLPASGSLATYLAQRKLRELGVAVIADGIDKGAMGTALAALELEAECRCPECIAAGRTRHLERRPSR